MMTEQTRCAFTPRAAILAALAAGSIALIYAWRIDEAAGLIVDDAWYLVLAKALAQGDGYRIISSAMAEILPVVPPGFPAILSVVFWLMPDYPANLLWIKLVSIASVAALGVVCWIDFRRHRELEPLPAACLVIATLLTPAIVFLATSTVMAESVFAFLQCLSVLLVERVTRRDTADWRAAVVAGVASAALILVRTAGAAVVIAAVVFFLLARRFRQTAVYVAVTVILLVPWMLYAQTHAPTDEERQAHGGTIAFSYSRLISMQQIGDPLSGNTPLGDLQSRVIANISRVFARDLGAIVLPVFYRSPVESGQEVLSIGGPGGGSMGNAMETMIISAGLAAVALFGWWSARRERLAMPALVAGATLIVIAPVNAQTFRYVVPLTPYILMFLWYGLRRGELARIALMVVIAFQLVDHGVYLRAKWSGTAQWVADAQENRELTDWMVANLREEGGVATTNPGLIYLATGRKTVSSGYASRNRAAWRAAGIRYMASTFGGTPPPRRAEYRLLYQTDRRGLWIVEMQ